MFDTMAYDFTEVGIKLLPPKEHGEEGLSESLLDGAHQSAKSGDSPLQVLPLKLEQQPQDGVGRLGMLLIYFS